MRFLRSRLMLALPLVVAAAQSLQRFPLLSYGIGYTVVNVGVALTIDRLITYPRGRVGRLINSRPPVAIGVMSYSIYLWQELVLDQYCSRAACAFPINLVLALGASIVSYLAVERPSLRARRWLASRLRARPPLPVPAPADAVAS